MKSKTTPEFWERYSRLPEQIQVQADRCYKLWLADHRHSSIRFKKLEGHESLYSVRIGSHYRAIAHVEDGIAVWTWIGSHADYDKLIK